MAYISREETLLIAPVRGLSPFGMDAVCAAAQLIPADILGDQDIRPATSR
jgi:hypothetical protein